MKFCSNCGHQVDDDVMFCDNCGNRFETEPTPVVPNQPSAPQEVVPPQYMYQPAVAAPVATPAPSAPPKGKAKKAVLITCITVAFVAVVAVTGVFGYLHWDEYLNIDAPSSNGKSNAGSSDTLSVSSTASGADTGVEGGIDTGLIPNIDSSLGASSKMDTESTIPNPNIDVGNTPYSYTKGTIKNGIYTNEWANLKFAIPSSWSDETAENQAKYPESVVDVGLYATDMTKGAVVQIGFEQSRVTNLDTYLSEMYEELKSTYSNLGKDFEVSNQMSVRDIGTNSYRSLTITVSSGSQVMMVQSIFARKLDDKLVMIIVSSIDEAKANAIVNSITSAR